MPSQFVLRCLINSISVLAILFAALPLQAGDIRDDVSAGLYLNLGADARYAAVGRVDLVESRGRAIGSGTLIDPSWVLTAGHVVDKATSLTFTINGTAYTADRWGAHPNWNGDLLAGNDLGLMHLSTPVADVQPAVRYRGRRELHKEATVVGYGMTGTGLTGAVDFDGKKRAGTNAVDLIFSRIRSPSRILLDDFDDPHWPFDNRMGSAIPLEMEYIIAPGDSGGGVFIETAKGPALIGVNSFVSAMSNPISMYGDIAGHTRTSPYNRWIDRVLRGRIQLPSGIATGTEMRLEPTSTSFGLIRDNLWWAPQTPEPATLIMLAAGAAVLLGRRRISR